MEFPQRNTFAQKVRSAVIRAKSPIADTPLLKEIETERRMIEMCSEALNFCRQSDEFRGSSNEAELERSLLLAVLHKRLLKKSLRSSSKGNSKVSETLDVTERADVTLKGVTLHLREELPETPERAKSKEWFLLVVTQGTNIWGSSPVPRCVGSSRLEFWDFAPTIKNLQRDLKIQGTVYRMDTLQIEDSTNRTLKQTWSKLVPSARDMVLRSPAFTKCGKLELGFDDLKSSLPWTLTGVPQGSILQGRIELELSCKVHLSTQHMGYLQYGEQTRGFVTWYKRWCVLQGSSLKLWNSARDEEQQPIKTINLEQCSSNFIAEVKRQSPGLSRTLLLETARSLKAENVNAPLNSTQDSTIERHLLAFDNIIDLYSWKFALNPVIVALQDWNAKFMKNPQHPSITMF